MSDNGDGQPEKKPARRRYAPGYGTRPSNEKIFQRVRHACDLLRKGLRKSEIKIVLGKQYGVSWWTAERYLRRAREHLKKECADYASEHVPRAVDVYLGMLRRDDAEVSPRVKLLAQKQLDRLFMGPVKIEHKIEGGLKHEHSVEVLKRVYKDDDARRAFFDLTDRLARNGANGAEALVDVETTE